MTSFDLNNYGSIFGPLLAAAPASRLGLGTRNRAKESELRALSVDAAFAPNSIVDRPAAEACLAGLWLMHDFLDESHKISQSIEDPNGSYWHAILHRREGDFSNAKYWFRRVGLHPIYPSLADWARRHATVNRDKYIIDAVSSDPWNPNWFVNLCAAATAGRPGIEGFCRTVQTFECLRLFDYCYHRAIER
jgi:hypothetical protein